MCISVYLCKLSGSPEKPTTDQREVGECEHPEGVSPPEPKARAIFFRVYLTPGAPVEHTKVYIGLKT